MQFKRPHMLPVAQHDGEQPIELGLLEIFNLGPAESGTQLQNTQQDYATNPSPEMELGFVGIDTHHSFELRLPLAAPRHDKVAADGVGDAGDGVVDDFAAGVVHA